MATTIRFQAALIGLILSACGIMPNDKTTCESGVVNYGEPSPGWAAIVQAVEDRCHTAVSGSITWAERGHVYCQNLDPWRVSGCHYADTCGVDVAVSYGPRGDEIPSETSAASTALAHELCHQLCTGESDEDAANRCATDVATAACALDTKDCL